MYTKDRAHVCTQRFSLRGVCLATMCSIRGTHEFTHTPNGAAAALRRLLVFSCRIAARELGVPFEFHAMGEPMGLRLHVTPFAFFVRSLYLLS